MYFLDEVVEIFFLGEVFPFLFEIASQEPSETRNKDAESPNNPM